MTAKWTDVITTTVPARVEREETEFELWTHKRSAHRCHQHPATPTEIGRGLQALEPAERGRVLDVAGVEPTPPATPEEIGEVLAGLEPDERGRALDAAGVPSATPEELAGVVAALPPDEHRRVLRALGYGAAPERAPEALGAELAALDVCEFMRAARVAGIVEARRLPRSSSPPLSVGGVPVMWSEIRVGEGDAPFDTVTRERDQARAALREAQRENIATARAADHWRERATAAEYAEREATAAADRAQCTLGAAQMALADTRAELVVAQRDRDAALLTLQAIRAERDNALVGRNQARAERDTARAESATLRQGRDVAVAQVATELARVRELAAERDRVRVERDQARAEARDVRNTVTMLYGAAPAEPRDVVETAGGRGCALLTERDGSTVKVTAGDPTLWSGAVVKVTGSVWFENVLVAARRAGVLL